MITVAIPILGRPARIKPAADAFTDPRLSVLFLPDATDTETLAELERYGLAYSLAPAARDFGVPTYASKVNHAFRVTDTPFILYAADDVAPKAGWVDAALKHLRNDTVGVLATNDTLNPANQSGRLATHGIVRRAYVHRHGSASLLGSGPIFCEGYRHVCCDSELSRLAIKRGAFKYAPDVVLAHRHPFGGTGVMDATYRLGYAHAARDRALFARRHP